MVIRESTIFRYCGMKEIPIHAYHLPRKHGKTNLNSQRSSLFCPHGHRAYWLSWRRVSHEKKGSIAHISRCCISFVLVSLVWQASLVLRPWHVIIYGLCCLMWLENVPFGPFFQGTPCFVILVKFCWKVLPMLVLTQVVNFPLPLKLKTNEHLFIDIMGHYYIICLGNV